MLKTSHFLPLLLNSVTVCRTGHNRGDQFDNLVVHFKKIIQSTMTSETQAKFKKKKDVELLKLSFFTDQQSSVLFFPEFLSML